MTKGQDVTHRSGKREDVCQKGLLNEIIQCILSCATNYETIIEKQSQFFAHIKLKPDPSLVCSENVSFF